MIKGSVVANFFKKGLISKTMMEGAMPVTTMLQHIIKVACTRYLLIFCILCYFFEHFKNHFTFCDTSLSSLQFFLLLLSFDASSIDMFCGACDGNGSKQFQHVSQFNNFILIHQFMHV